jgi:hypothetical protein
MKIHPAGAELFRADGRDEALQSLFAVFWMRLQIENSTINISLTRK